MFNIITIVESNRKTFYDFSTEKENNTLTLNLIKFLVALFSSYVFSIINDTFISIVVTAFSILVGFTFNVLFHLLSSNKINVSFDEVSIEKSISIKRINKLYDELFANVSYFNLVSIFVIMLSLLYVVIGCKNPNFLLSDYIVNAYVGKIILNLKFCIVYVYKTIFYFLLIESLYTFIRIIGRIHFYFQHRIELQQSCRH